MRMWTLNSSFGLSLLVVSGLFGLFYFSADSASAAMINTGVTDPLGFSDVDTFLGKILGWLQSVIVVFALIFLLIGAFFYLTSGGDSGRVETAKNCIFYALLGVAIGVAAPAFIKQIYDILGATTPTLPSGGTSLTLLQIAQKLLDFLLSIVGVVAIIMLVVGAFMYLTAAGDEDRIDTGKKIAKYSLIGITIALASLLLVRQIANLLL